MDDVTLVVNYHREGHLAKISAASALRAADQARAKGLPVKLCALLDRPDDCTRIAVESTRAVWDMVEECDLGDLGLARNLAVSIIETQWMAFMDGDDLCGDQWLAEAQRLVEREECSRAFLHPEWIFYFNDADLLLQSQTATPLPGAKSFFMRQVDSSDPLFDMDVIRFNNVYTSNQLGRTALYREFPFISIDRDRGFGVEDWTWNATTLAAGVRHRIVHDAVHLVRVKSAGSLGAENEARGLLPDLQKLGTVGRNQI